MPDYREVAERRLREARERAGPYLEAVEASEKRHQAAVADATKAKAALDAKATEVAGLTAAIREANPEDPAGLLALDQQRRQAALQLEALDERARRAAAASEAAWEQVKFDRAQVPAYKPHYGLQGQPNAPPTLRQPDPIGELLKAP